MGHMVYFLKTQMGELIYKNENRSTKISQPIYKKASSDPQKICQSMTIGKIYVNSLYFQIET